MTTQHIPTRPPAWQGRQLTGSTARAYERFLVPAIFGRARARPADRVQRR
ncbi:hypothetical protein [Nocardiopsis aegyptia]|uniref:Uncharacterized protein n=1 Tax=Nocardiopsis aegyptia TaxID=220378 RepID=A0A7Z0J9E5_9ACTN|nr:hypothetical protein [Nocardiopsis aegyptia]NYJ33409.1 hypothetical protein [Nocardiopsis aegyptia]